MQTVESNPKFRELLDGLKSLNLPPDQFALFGSGPMAVRGLREPGDFDVLVSSELFDELAKKFTVEQGWHGRKIKGVVKDVDIYDATAAPISVNELIGRADVIDGIRYLRLRDVIAAKKAEGREKDLRDIKIIEEYIKSEL